MNKGLLILSFSLLLFFGSCKKEDAQNTESVFTSAIRSDIDVIMAGSIQLEDGNYLLVSRDKESVKPGRMVKISAGGEVLWDKEGSPLNCLIWRVFPIPGTGYATLGIASIFESFMTVCVYDNDGNLLSTHRINTNCSNSWVAPFSIIRLSNGNYALAGSDVAWYGYGYLKILDPEFNLLYSKAFTTPIPGYFGFNICGLSEMPDKSIAITATTTYANAVSLDSASTNMIILRTALNGNTLSSTFIYDFDNSETPNVVLPYNNGMFVVSARMKGWYGGNGTFITYINNNGSGSTIAATINLVRLTADGKFEGRTEIHNYPQNGVINSAVKTTDGGYILCGTVNQASATNLVSKTKIYLLKLDANLHQQWSKIINTTYTTFGMYAFQTSDGGYLVGGHQKSLDKRFEMLVLKTDENGNY